MESLEDIQQRIEALAARIDAPAKLLPTYGRSEDGARPHLEVDDRYHFVVVERGQELERRSTDDLGELLYWAFGATTFSMAVDYEVRNRVEGRDFRRMLFATQEQLMARLSPAWGRRKAAERVEVLRRHPFTDEPRGVFAWLKGRG